MNRLAGYILGVVVLLGAGCDGASGPAEPAEPAEVRLGGAWVRTAVETSLRDTEVHLNNYGAEGEERDHSWHRSDDSYIRLGANLGGGEFRFNVAESRSDSGPFRLLYYVNDLNVRADSLTVAVAADSLALLLVVHLPFEEEGTEFKGHCLSRVFGQVRGCLGSADRIAPDIQLRKARLAVTLRPVVHRGSLSFEVARVAFDADVQAGGVCAVDLGVTAIDVCNALAGYRDDIREAMETHVQEGFNDPVVRDDIAAGLRPLLDALGIGTVAYVARSGDDLVVGHYPLVQP